MKQLEAALHYRQEGRYDEAVKALTRLINDPKIGDGARYELALLMHARGQHEQGDRHAAALGFKYRLNDIIFKGGCGVNKTSTGNDNIRVFDNLIPPEMLRALQEVFGPRSDFWVNHGYPTEVFFSYNSPLQSQQKEAAPSHKRAKKCNPGTSYTQTSCRMWH